MNYKIIEKKDIKKIYPRTFDQNVLKTYGLMDTSLNTAFCYFYSCYKFYLEVFLAQELPLRDLEKKLIELNIQENEKENFYKTSSNWNSKYLFLRNTIFLDRLSEKEFQEFQELQKINDSEKILEFIKKTYKKIIKFENGCNDNQIVNYDTTNRKSILSENNALVIGIDCKTGLSQDFLDNLESEYSKLLQIPVCLYFNNQKMFRKGIEKLEPIPLLPIGSVVKLKSNPKKVMLVGYAPITIEKESRLYDYLGCYYPEGIVSHENYILFNHDKINEIYAIGPIDIEVKAILSNFQKIKKEGKKDLFLKEYNKTKE